MNQQAYGVIIYKNIIYVQADQKEEEGLSFFSKKSFYPRIKSLFLVHVTIW